MEGNSRFIGGGNIDELQSKFNYDFGNISMNSPVKRIFEQ